MGIAWKGRFGLEWRRASLVDMVMNMMCYDDALVDSLLLAGFPVAGPGGFCAEVFFPRLLEPCGVGSSEVLS